MKSPASSNMNGKDRQNRSIDERLRLQDIVQRTALQEVQDLFAAMAGMCLALFDRDGGAVTVPSRECPVCCDTCLHAATDTVCGCIKRGEKLDMDISELADVREAPCPEGSERYLVPIRLGGVTVGVLVVTTDVSASDPIEGETTTLMGMPHAGSVGPEAEAAPGGLARVRKVFGLLHFVFNTLVEVGHDGYQLGKSVRELSALLDIGRLFASTLDLAEVLHRVARTVTETFGAKGCGLRLLDESSGKLELAATYNLSQAYIDKGPVFSETSAIDRDALAGRIVPVYDIREDPRITYRDAMVEENLVSQLTAGIINKGKPLGVIRLYTSRPRRFSEDELGLFELIANSAAMAIDNALLHKSALEKERLEHELRVAAQVQANLLPKACPTIPGYDMCAVSLASRTVAGDFYDFIEIPPDHLGIAIGDAQGNGMPAALLMATVRSALRAQIENAYSTEEIIYRVNNSFCHDTRVTSFVTLFYGALNIDSGLFTFTNAGHNPPFLFRAGSVSRLQSGGLVVGIQQDARYKEGQVTLQAGDVVLFYTDGAVECMNSRDEMFGANRLADAVRESIDLAAVEINDHIRSTIRAFLDGGEPQDDLTLVVLKVIDKPSRPPLEESP